MSKEKEISSTSQLAANGFSSSTATPIDSLEKIIDDIHGIAEQHQADPLVLLQLLRMLEQLHRDIQQDYFQSALPNSRQSLYALLRDIEENGGWPYIQRWKLQALFANLPEDDL